MAKYFPVKHLSQIFFFYFLISAYSAASQVIETTQPLIIDHTKMTIRTRFSPPKGFAWVRETPGSFGEYVVNFPLYPATFPVRDYEKIPIDRQTNHIAVLKVDVGEKDLQQCADAWIRLYSEYLWSQKRFDEIVFEFTSGQPLSWNDYKNGLRTTEKGSSVTFRNTGKIEDSYANFRRYLNLVFNYAGTISLDRESVPILQNSQIQTGDFLIKPGSPGHSVIIVGVARNISGKKLYLLAESFMPAQDIHILRNNANSAISPWYELDVNATKTVTAKYVFEQTAVKRFHALIEKK